MAVDYQALQAALTRYTAGLKAKILEGEDASVDLVDQLMTEMQTAYEAASTEQGNGEGTVTKSIVEKVQALPANTIDCAVANHFTKTIVGPVQLAVANPAAAGFVTTFVLHLTNAGANVTFWAGVKWSAGVKPTLSIAGRDVLAFSTSDGGVTWDGYLIGLDMKAAA